MPFVQNLIKPTPSRFKAELNSRGIPASNVAPYLGFSYPHTVNLLNGVSRISPEVEEKLQALLDQLDSQEGPE